MRPRVNRIWNGTTTFPELIPGRSDYRILIRDRNARRPHRDGRLALEDEADRLTDWLAGARVVHRFPSPLSKAIADSDR